MDPCAGLHILAHGSIPLPYLPNLCAVLRPAPLDSYYFPFLSFPLLSPCIGLSLDPLRLMLEISVVFMLPISAVDTVKLVMFACSKYCVFFIFSFMRVLINANLHQVRYLKQKGQIYACFNYCVLMHSH